MAAEDVAGKGKQTKIHVVFLSPGHPVGFEAYRRYHPDIKIMENQDVLDTIKGQCAGIAFSGKAVPVKTQDAVQDIAAGKKDLDGLLVFGAPPDELIGLGLPMVAVARPLEQCPTLPFHAYKQSKVATSTLPVHCDKDPKVYASRIADIVGKINLIDSISRMKGQRILVITDLPPLGYFEPIELQIDTTRKEYETTYVDNLKAVLGIQLVTIPQEELFEKIRNADVQQSEKVARKWIKEAVAVRGTNEAEVVKSAKLYLSMKELMATHDCQAITTEGFGWPPFGFQKAVEKDLPSQGMPTSQLLTDGIPAASETLLDCLITQQFALYITGSAGLLGDYNIDPLNNTAIVCHCEGSIKPYADDRRSPYIIRNLPFVEENKGGVCAEIQYPIGEPITVAKLSVYKKKMSLFTGETVSGEELFPYWADILGRNKVAVRTDAKALLENVDWTVFGHHRTAFYGDHRQEFKDLAKLIGFEVIEKDR
jgi:hypothetical protein